MRILAIDDEPLFCSILVANLAKIGIANVDVAHSGEQALSFVSQARQPYDCFLVDIRMEPMDGIELVHRLRTKTDYRLTPIIMISALTEKSAIDAAFQAGANDYITKPLDPVELKARISMARNINDARLQTKTLHDHVISSEQSRFASVRFDNPLVLEDVAGLTSLMALENYTLKLGNLRLHSTRAVAFKIDRAEDLFSRLDSISFVDLLADLAALISHSISGSPHLLAYAGSGFFVAIAPRSAVTDCESLQATIDEHLLTLRAYYAQTGLTAPSIHVGQPARTSLFSFESPTRMIDTAIASHRNAGIERRPRKPVSWT